jgi:DNA-binding NarL/FixJ family response regulator
MTRKRQERRDPAAKTQITILLAEDNATFRKSLKSLVQLDGGMQVVGEAKDGLEAVQLAKALKPNVIVMDIAMPLMNGLQATEKIMAVFPGIRILMLSAHPEAEYIQMAMSFGASGYLMKQSSTEFLAHAVRKVLSGRTYFSAGIPKKLRSECQEVFEKWNYRKSKQPRQSSIECCSR